MDLRSRITDKTIRGELPMWLHELADEIGLADTIAAIDGLGGATIYFPHSPENGHGVVAERLKPEQAARLGRKFGGGRIYLPRCHRALMAWYVWQGWSVLRIALHLRVSERTVEHFKRDLASALGLCPPHRGPERFRAQPDKVAATSCP